MLLRMSEEDQDYEGKWPGKDAMTKPTVDDVMKLAHDLRWTPRDPAKVQAATASLRAAIESMIAAPVQQAEPVSEVASSGCHYLTFPDQICNKCGKVHGYSRAGGVSMYTIENRAGVDVLVMGKGAQPATEAESAFYAEVVRLRADVEALRADAERKRIELENMGDTVTSLRSEVALYRGESEKLRDLLNYVPLPPVAITYERGWKLIDMLQAAAIDAARAAQGQPA